MKILIFLFCFTQTFVVFSQSIKLKILSQEDKSPVQYASVILINSKLGYYTNEFGEINIDLPLNDSLSISCTGYENKTVLTSILKKQSLIYLKTKVLKLDEITVKTKKKNKYKISNVGYYWDKHKRYYLKPVIGTQWAIYLKNNEIQDGLLETLNFKFLKGEQTKTSRIMIKLYSLDENCYCPSNEILQDALIQDVQPKQNSLIINILGKNIKFPQKGLFISIEILGFVNNGVYEPIKFGYKVEPVIALSNDDNKYENWIKSPFVKGGWHKFFVKNKLMFGATVLY